MRILLAPIGSRGDVQPMLALAEALRAQGHTAAFCAPPTFATVIGGRGFAFHPTGMDVAAFMDCHAAAVVAGPGLQTMSALYA
ncbi:MAG: glycosyltransferase, partial [Planctomycetes bacterium]|nr:glycosyltransferase [Planctomycetota bacterium]